MPRRVDTRAELLAATRAAIAEEGLGGVTAREVTGRAGANLASIGYHFGSKDALVAEALVEEVTELVAPVLEVLGSGAPDADRASAAVALLDDLFDASQARIPAYLAALSVVPHDAEVRHRLAALFVEVRQRLAADIERQAAAGHLAGWVDPQPMAALILAVVQGVVVAAALEPSRVDEGAHRAVAGQLLGLLMAARAPS